MSVPNMREIAAAAGVSKSTVSLALRNDPRLAAATRQRVQEVAEKLGYRRNAVVANLMSQLRASKTPKFQANLAFLNCAPEAKILQWHTFHDFREGVRRRAWQFGYGLEDFWIRQPGVSVTRLFSILRVRNIRGLILGAVLDPLILRQELTEGLPHHAVAALGVNSTSDGLGCALVDQFQTARTATANAFRLGYERPALVLAENLDRLLDRRFSAGYLAAWRDRGASAPPALPFIEDDRAGFLSWFRAHRPDALITAHLPLHDWLVSDGWKVPEDVALIHLDRQPRDDAWSGMDQNNEQVGANAADLVISQINRNENGPSPHAKMILTQAVWTPGPTTRPE